MISGTHTGTNGTKVEFVGKAYIISAVMTILPHVVWIVMTSCCRNSHTLPDMDKKKKKNVQLTLKEFHEETSRMAGIECQASLINGVYQIADKPGICSSPWK